MTPEEKWTQHLWDVYQLNPSDVEPIPETPGFWRIKQECNPETCEDIVHYTDPGPKQHSIRFSEPGEEDPTRVWQAQVDAL